MDNNKTFYKKASEGKVSFREIFSDMFKKHTPEQNARLFMAGTPLSTPSEADMLHSWIKPYVFIWVLGAFLALCAVIYALMAVGYTQLAPLIWVFGSLALPLALLTFFWELNVPRNIPVYTVLLMLVFGGVLSLAANGVFRAIFPNMKGNAIYAPLYEEPAKLAIVMLFLRKPERKYILNGLLIGAAVGAGFEFMESAGYNFTMTLSGGISSGTTNVLLRGLTAGGGHLAWAAMYGGALAAVKGAQPLSIKHLGGAEFLKYFAAAFALHMFNNSGLVSFIPCTIITTVGAWVLLFFLIRKGLQQVTDISHRAGGGVAVPAAPAAGQGAYPVLTPNAVPVSAPYGLRGVSGAFKGQGVVLNQGDRIVIGRNPQTSNLVCDANTVGISGTHCALEFTQGGLMLTDLGSTNGTFVNGKRIPANQPVHIHGGVSIKLGGGDAEFSVRHG